MCAFKGIYYAPCAYTHACDMHDMYWYVLICVIRCLHENWKARNFDNFMLESFRSYISCSKRHILPIGSSQPGKCTRDSTQLFRLIGVRVPYKQEASQVMHQTSHSIVSDWNIVKHPCEDICEVCRHDQRFAVCQMRQPGKWASRSSRSSGCMHKLHK